MVFTYFVKSKLSKISSKGNSISSISLGFLFNPVFETPLIIPLEFGVFDNLQRMIRTGEEKDMAQASGAFKDLVMELRIPFLLVSQPRKRKSEETNKMMTFHDLKGSSAIPADADQVILLNRKRKTQEKGEEVINEEWVPDAKALLDDIAVLVDKSRFSAGGAVMLKFIGEKSRIEVKKRR